MARQDRRRQTVAVALIAAGVVLVTLALVAALSGPSPVDVAVHTWFVTHRVAWLTSAMIGVSTVFGTAIEPVMVGLVALALWWRRAPRSALALIAAMVGCVAVSEGTKLLVGRERPSLALQLGPAETSMSFPSGHTFATATFTLVAGFLWWRLRHTTARLALWIGGATGCTVLVAISRLYLGVHWLDDTIASVGLALIILAVVMLAARWLDPPPPAAVATPAAARPA